MASQDTAVSGGYREPSEVLKRLFLPPKTPSLTLSSDYRWLMYTGQPPLPSIQVLAWPEEKLAGLRFDPVLLAPSRLEFSFDLKAQALTTSSTSDAVPPELTDIPLPPDSEGIRYLRFNPNPPEYAQQQFVFCSKRQNQPLLEVFVCNLTRDNDWEVHPVPALQNRRLNFVNGCAYQFTSDGTSLLCKVVPQDHPAQPPDEPPVPLGPSIQRVAPGAKKAPGRTYQDLLKNPHDEDKFRYFLTTELLKVDLRDVRYATATVVPQSKGGFLSLGMESSPCGRYLLVESITELSYSVPLRRFGKDVLVWDLEHTANDPASNGNGVLVAASNPVDDEIPLSYDACSRHKRRFHFHPLLPHNRDPANEAYQEGNSSQSFRDALYTQEIGESTTTTAAAAAVLQDPVELCKLEWRLDDVDFTESGTMLVDEYRWSDRMERKWKLVPGTEKTLVWERSWEDRYSSPGAPVYKRNQSGKYVVREPTPGTIYLKGAGASPLGDRPFLDRMHLESGAKERLWRCKAPTEGALPDPKHEEVGGTPLAPEDRQDVYESLVVLLDDEDSMLLSRESKTTPTNYYLASLSDSSKERTITTFPHPQPDLRGVEKELVKYQRKDGVELTANLYLPADYDGTPRPTLFWAYPREFKNPKAAGQVKGSQHRFVSAHYSVYCRASKKEIRYRFCSD